MTGSVNNNQGPKVIRSLDDIRALQNSGKDIKNLESIFKRFNTDGNEVLDEGEGSIHYFEDGSISVTKDGKTVAGVTDKGTQFNVKYDGDKSIYEFGDGATSTRQGSVTVSATSAEGNEYVRGDNGNFTPKNETKNYKERTINGKQYILSSNNQKLAMKDEEGNLHTGFTKGDSFEGTLIRLGLNPSNPEVRTAMEQANPTAAGNKQFQTGDSLETGMEVCIPKSLLDNYNVQYFSSSIRLVPKPEEE